MVAATAKTGPEGTATPVALQSEDTAEAAALEPEVVTVATARNAKVTGPAAATAATPQAAKVAGPVTAMATVADTATSERAQDGEQAAKAEERVAEIGEWLAALGDGVVEAGYDRLGMEPQVAWRGWPSDLQYWKDNFPCLVTRHPSLSKYSQTESLSDVATRPRP